MRTKINLTRTNPTNGKPFYFLQIETVDNIGFTLQQSSAMISEEQYIDLRQNKEEHYNGQSNIYYVIV